uniref:Protein kinase domain-containing protein n=1 Tax=Heterorhabditis bacteriophora TaxID=37862 RepID=A0A1I7XI01_HETBA
MVYECIVDLANGTLLDTLVHPGVAVADPTGRDRERMVQAFVRQLLLALQSMHEKRIAHLDLRPETILLQDSKLKLANFGQAKRLLRGMVTGTIQGSPEFVSPEIVRGYPLTLATDLWSVGTLTYVLLTGISPFHGDNDNETLNNVDKCNYSVSGDEWGPFSTDAADFVKNLLKEVPADRMTCEEALQHSWLVSPDLKDAQLSADGLREFKYKHKWLVPSVTTAHLQRAQLGGENSTRPVEIYDYLRVKERPATTSEEVARKRKERPPVINDKGIPTDPWVRLEGRDWRNHGKGESKFLVDQNGKQIDWKRVPLDQFEDLARIPHDSFGRPINLNHQRNFVDQFGKPLTKQEELIQPQQRGPVQIDQFGRTIRGQHRPQDRARPPPDYNMLEKKKLIPQEKGETPSKKEERIPKDIISNEELFAQVPLRMIRGERRDIEEEIANRILSDISEEGSVAGSLASLDDFEAANSIKQYRDAHQKSSLSRSTTPHAESDASTPTISPVNTVKESRIFFSESVMEELPLRDKEV